MNPLKLCPHLVENIKNAVNYKKNWQLEDIYHSRLKVWQKFFSLISIQKIIKIKGIKQIQSSKKCCSLMNFWDSGLDDSHVARRKAADYKIDGFRK